MTRRGLIIDHPGLPAAPDQRAALDDRQVDDVIELAPRTQEDWHYRIREALDGLEAHDAVVVAELPVLGLSAVSLLDSLEAIASAHISLVSLGEGVDTTDDDSFLAHAQAISAALEAGRLIQARAIVARARNRGPVTPPKAEFVERSLWEATNTEPTEN